MAELERLSRQELHRRLRTGLTRVQSGSLTDSYDRIRTELDVHQVELEIQNRELRDAQHALEVSRDRYADLYDFAPIGLLSIDRAGIIFEANSTAASMIGKARETLIGLPLSQHLAREDRRALLNFLLECRRQGAARRDFTLIAGSALSLAVQLYATRKNGGVYRVAMSDITERKQAEQALRHTNEDLELRVEQRTRDLAASNRTLALALDENNELMQRLRANVEELSRLHRAKDEFLAILSHELRNPLSPIITGLEVLQRHLVKDELGESVVMRITRQVGQLQRLVDDLLDVNRLLSGKLTLLKAKVDLCSICRTAVETVSAKIGEQGHPLRVELPDEAVWIDGDEQRLVQVVVNLLTNAIKYTPDGGPIHLSLHCEDTKAVITVRDTGIGISAAALPRIFELYVQEEDALRQCQGGLGIGLSLVKGVVEMHGGSVEAHSGGRGFGSEFIVRLPRC